MKNTIRVSMSDVIRLLWFPLIVMVVMIRTDIPKDLVIQKEYIHFHLRTLSMGVVPMFFLCFLRTWIFFREIKKKLFTIGDIWAHMPPFVINKLFYNASVVDVLIHTK